MNVPSEDITPGAPVWWSTLSPADRAELAASDAVSPDGAPDVLVVGGGLVGLCLAQALAERGAAVRLIEARTLAAGASGANAGGIWPNDQGPLYGADFQALAFESRDLWARLSLRPGFGFDWRVNGLLNVNSNRIGPDAPAVAAALQDQGYAVQAVDGEQIERLEPRLRKGLAGGLHYPSEAQVNPVKAAAALARSARKLGATLTSGVAATAIELRDGRVAGVQTTAGTIAARHVVAASGWMADWVRALATDPGATPNDTPARPNGPALRPVSGQLIATDPQPPLLKGTVIGEHIVFQLRSGEVVTGGNVLESDCLEPNEQLSRQFAAAARELIPALAGVPFTRAWCGLRPASPDSLPIIDRHSGLENLWLACGHYKNGVLLAPATGRLLAEWITTGNRPERLVPFRADRSAT